MGRVKQLESRIISNFGKYAVGGIGFSMTNQFILVYLTFFCTDIFRYQFFDGGRSDACCIKIIDAVIDPLMGVYCGSDKNELGGGTAILNLWRAPILGSAGSICCSVRRSSLPP